TFGSSITGGTGALTYEWEFGDGAKGTGTTVDHTYGSAGTYTVSLWVNDSSGGSLQRTLNVTVTKATTILGAATSPSNFGLLAAILVIVVIVAIASLLLIRRRKSAAAPSEVSTVPESEAESQDPPSADPAEEPPAESPPE
ncbi:MAG: PKD domain-containing protein, partial [Thermoplasmata archaeon]|nr:PKD domain-containing protein [Thermoplasmata archaeon]